jgi:hypothetical protein
LRFYTKEESENWLDGRGRKKPDLIPGVRAERIEYPAKAHHIFFIAHWVATTLTYGQPALLLLSEWGIWGSSENWHLYYKLRQSYGDQRLLHEAPGHLFLEYEAEDLASFLQVAMLNGWGGYILTGANYVNAFFSHDEYIDFFGDKNAGLAEIREALGPKDQQRVEQRESTPSG